MYYVIVRPYMWPDRNGDFSETMFHGIARRKGVMGADSEYSTIDDRHKYSLMISKSTFSWSDVFSPGPTFIVSSKFRDAIGVLPHVEYEKITFEHLAYVPFELGRFVYPEFGYPDRSAEAVLRSTPDSSGTIAVDDFFELILHRHNWVAEQFHDTVGAPFNFYHDPKWKRTEELAVCESMIEEFPVLLSQFGVLFRDSVFRSIEHFFNWEHFFRAVVASK